ncbi:Cof subfamily protein (haloacid dehalogenase superfamily)/HAD superfamily hydrolase (TIGR01484 family) [Microbacterium sp. AG790]|uniref:HAD family hydrolase n=1 Tax=Microbacterium sp. AG790 TaxID=2183995 RepID=UPI000EAD4EEA|nr:HAD-IIB family hydrolase [Microbacterium sp. AG790]RKS92993.1 Cof subfamily protein (haloacid dehalogenase superfamily)/HAD superfamily hydrolase (TIGR01484 family) [Microbacterium sp. AG790]
MSGARAEDRLPPTGAIEVVDAPEAAHLVDDLATDAENPAVTTERLLIALDVDGTVLLEDETLSPGVVDAIAHAHRAGHEVMLATGRSWESTRGIQHVLELAPEYAVCSNGAVIMKRIGGDFAEEGRYERFHVETFDPSEVVELLRAHLPHAKYMVELADGERLYTERLDDWNLAHARRVDFAELVAQPVCRVVVVSPDDTDEDFLALVERIGLNKVSYAVGWSAWLDIAPQGVDKSTALERVRTWLGVEPDRVLVMGDGRNDLGMFRWALDHGGRAIAMGQGPDDVRREAGEVTASVHAGGVAEILRDL